MAEIDVLKAQIVRQDLNTPWGFRLQGGIDQGEPLNILRLTPGSPAAKIGLKAADQITEIGDVPSENLTYAQAHDIINQYGDSIVLTVERRARGSIPVNPVINKADDSEAIKSYQTYDMSGPKASERPQTNPTYIPAASVDQNLPAAPVFVPVALPAGPRPDTREAPKSYQTYDLSGPRPLAPQGSQHDYQFHTVTAKPFIEAPQPYQSPAVPAEMYHAPAPPPPAPAAYTTPQAQTQSPPLQHPTYSPAPPEPSYQPQYSPEYYPPEYPGDEPDQGGIQQSRTFKTLASLMHNDEPVGGVTALPPLRSVSQEQWKQEQAMKAAPGAGSPRVKVFMPQQYNSPLGMYSAKNVVETFQAQAETMMETMERKQYEEEEHQPVTGTYNAVAGN